MPSFPDLSHEHDHDADLTAPHVGGPTAPEYILDRVKVEGLRRRHRRHRRNAVLAALGLVVIAVPAIALLPSDDGDDAVTVANAPEDTIDDARDEVRPTTQRPESGSTTVPPGETATTIAPSVTATTAVQETDAEAPVVTSPPAPAPTVTTVPAPTCRNSTDPACGEFRWDPAPGPNQPLTAAFVDVPATVTAGEPVTFFVAWSDPDAQLTFDHFSPDGVGLASGCVAERRYGPWTPPDPAAGSGELSYTHTFAAPGEYLVVVSLGTGTCGEPYASERTVELTVTVA